MALTVQLKPTMFVNKMSRGVFSSRSHPEGILCQPSNLTRRSKELNTPRLLEPL